MGSIAQLPINSGMIDDEELMKALGIARPPVTPPMPPPDSVFAPPTAQVETPPPPASPVPSTLGRPGVSPGPLPEEARVQQFAANAPPQLHGWKRGLDIAGQLALPGVERMIPGTPGNYDRQLGTLSAEAVPGENAQKAILGRQQDVATLGRTAAETALKNAEAIRTANLPLSAVRGGTMVQPAGGGAYQQIGEPNVAAAAVTKGIYIDPQGNVFQGHIEPGLGVINEITGKPVPDAKLYEKPSAAAKMNPFQLWSSDPAKYAEWIKASKTNTGMGTYAAIRFLDIAMKYEPAMLPSALAMIKASGVQIPPELMAQLPPGFAHTREGATLGASAPLGPTQTTKNSGQFADKALDEIPRIRQNINELSSQLGPLMGRWNQFMTGNYGSGTSPQVAQKFEALRTDMHFLTANAARFHLNSIRSVQDFNKLANVGKMTAPVLNGFIDAMGKWAQDAQREAQSPAMASRPGGNAPAAAGASVTMIGGDGKSYQVPSSKVSQAVKDGFRRQ